MKKHLIAFLVIMTASLSACLVSCGEKDPLPEDQKDPDGKVTMGTYSLYRPSITLTYWPDSEAGITSSFETYYNGIAAALNIGQDKKYKWSDIEADRERLQAIFNGIDDFEYSVKSCRNYTSTNGDVTFGAFKEGSIYPDIDFGSKKIICKLDVPADATCQLHIEMTSYETAVPSAKEYNTKVRTLFTEALKEVFTEPYGLQENKTSVQYLNMVNRSGSRAELSERVKKACEAVVVPDLPADIRKDAQAATSPSGAKLSNIFVITLFSYDPQSNRILKSEEEVFTRSIGIN